MTKNLQLLDLGLSFWRTGAFIENGLDFEEAWITSSHLSMDSTVSSFFSESSQKIMSGKTIFDNLENFFSDLSFFTEKVLLNHEADADRLKSLGDLLLILYEREKCEDQKWIRSYEQLVFLKGLGLFLDFTSFIDAFKSVKLIVKDIELRDFISECIEILESTGDSLTNCFESSPFPFWSGFAQKWKEGEESGRLHSDLLDLADEIESQIRRKFFPGSVKPSDFSQLTEMRDIRLQFYFELSNLQLAQKSLDSFDLKEFLNSTKKDSQLTNEMNQVFAELIYNPPGEAVLGLPLEERILTLNREFSDVIDLLEKEILYGVLSKNY